MLSFKSINDGGNLRPNLLCPLRWWQRGQSSGPPERSRFWYCPWSLCFSQHWKQMRNQVHIIRTWMFWYPGLYPCSHLNICQRCNQQLKIPVEATARALMASSRGEGCCGESRGVRGARGVRAHRTRVTQLVQVVHLIFWTIHICQNITHGKACLPLQTSVTVVPPPMDTGRTQYLGWQGLVLLNQYFCVSSKGTHCSYLGEHRAQATLSWEAPRRPCSQPWSRSPISVSHPEHINEDFGEDNLLMLKEEMDNFSKKSWLKRGAKHSPERRRPPSWGRLASRWPDCPPAPPQPPCTTSAEI